MTGSAPQIVGVGESDIGRVHGLTGLGLNAQAALRAVTDAGLQKADIDGLITAYSFSEPYFMLGTVLCEYLGIRPSFVRAITLGGATPGAMVRDAMSAIESGLCDNVLVVTGEKRLTGQSRSQSVEALSAIGHPFHERPYGMTIPSMYALIARRHMTEYGTTEEDLAAVTVSARRHASLHPNAHMRSAVTVDDVLTSKPIAEPLRLLNCCLISDAAGAIVVSRRDEADRRGVHLAGYGEAHSHEHVTMNPILTESAAGASSELALGRAGVSIDDLSFAQLYDCFGIVPIIELEDIGVVERGQGGEFFRHGHGGLDGKLPINTHGGMLAHAHAGAAGGLFAVIESVRQLRGECGDRQVANAEVGLVHLEGGVMSSHSTLVLARA